MLYNFPAKTCSPHRRKKAEAELLKTKLALKEELDNKELLLRQLHSEKVKLEQNTEILQGRVNRLQATARMTSIDLSRLDVDSAEFIKRYSGNEVSDHDV